MTSTHYSTHAHLADAEEAARTAAKRKWRKYGALGAIAAVVIVPTAAYAMISGIFGTGNVSGTAGVATSLSVNQTGLDQQKLFPGSSLNVKFNVTNPNPFPVQVTKVQATTFSSSDCGGANLAWFSGSVSALNQDVTLTTPVTVDANGSALVTVPNGISLSSNATKGCSFTIGVKVTAAQSGAAVQS